MNTYFLWFVPIEEEASIKTTLLHLEGVTPKKVGVEAIPQIHRKQDWNKTIAIRIDCTQDCVRFMREFQNQLRKGSLGMHEITEL